MLSLLSFLALLACFAGDGEQQDAKQYTGLHTEWMRLHDSGESTARLKIDPAKRSMWLKCRGERQEKLAVSLPSGLTWYAFQISNQGLRQVTFPLRLQEPREQVEKDSAGESLLIVGMGKDQGFRMSFSATTSGIGFHSGSGNRTGDITVYLPAKVEGPTKYKSFVASDSPRHTNWRESIQTKDFALQIQRRPAAE